MAAPRSKVNVPESWSRAFVTQTFARALLIAEEVVVIIPGSGLLSNLSTGWNDSLSWDDSESWTD